VTSVVRVEGYNGVSSGVIVAVAVVACGIPQQGKLLQIAVVDGIDS